jgi:hypothetical protein
MKQESPTQRPVEAVLFRPSVQQLIEKDALLLLIEQQILSWNIRSQKAADIDVYTTLTVKTEKFLRKTYLKWCQAVDERRAKVVESKDWEYFWELSKVHALLCSTYELQIFRNSLEAIILYSQTPAMFASQRTLKRLKYIFEYLESDINWINYLYEHGFELIKRHSASPQLKKQTTLILQSALALKKYFYSTRFEDHIESIREAIEQLPKHKRDSMTVASIEVSIDTWQEHDTSQLGFALMDNRDRGYTVLEPICLTEFPWQQQSGIAPYSKFPQDKEILEQSSRSAAKNTILQQLKSKYTLAQLESLLAKQ